MLGQEFVQEALDGGEPVGVHGEEVPGAVPGLVGKSGIAQHPQMVRGGLLRQSEFLGDPADRTRPTAHDRQDRPPIRVRQRAQRPIEVGCELGGHGAPSA